MFVCQGHWVKVKVTGANKHVCVCSLVVCLRPKGNLVTVTVTEALVLRPLTRRPRAHHRVNPYPGARRQNETKCFQWPR